MCAYLQDGCRALYHIACAPFHTAAYSGVVIAARWALLVYTVQLIGESGVLVVFRLVCVVWSVCVDSTTGGGPLLASVSKTPTNTDRPPVGLFAAGYEWCPIVVRGECDGAWDGEEWGWQMVQVTIFPGQPWPFGGLRARSAERPP